MKGAEEVVQQHYVTPLLDAANNAARGDRTAMTGQTRRQAVETALRELAKALRAEETEQRAFDRVGGSIKPGTKVPRCGE
jgi:hypothetical protein